MIINISITRYLTYIDGCQIWSYITQLGGENYQLLTDFLREKNTSAF